MSRPYVQTRRAAAVDDTRRRIVEAAVHLHGTVGPARTSISAIAAQAGVQRLTVYRHFEDDAAIFAACSSHWTSAHPPPDPSAWAGRRGVRAVRAALAALYAYYETTAPMWRLVYRDTPVVPAMEEPFREWLDYLAAVRDGLLDALNVPKDRRVLAGAAVAHALAFPTWDSFTVQGVTSREIATLMSQLVGQVARRPVSTPIR